MKTTLTVAGGFLARKSSQLLSAGARRITAIIKVSCATCVFLCTSLTVNAQLNIVYTSNQPDILLKKNIAHFPHLSTLLKKLRNNHNNTTLFLHGGDSFSPSAISLFDNANNIIALANKMDVSLYSVGKRELTYDIDILSLRSLDAQFPIISSNVIDKRSAMVVEGLLPNYRFEVEGFTVAVASLINPRALITYAPELAEISAMASVLPEIIENQKDADFKILMTDLKKPASLEIAKHYDFDLILVANDGIDEIIKQGDTTIVLGGGQDGDTVVIEYDNNSNKLTARVEQLSNYQADPNIIAFIDQYQRRLGKIYNEKIALAASDFNTEKKTIRTRETALANIFTDALRNHENTDIAILNSGSIRSSEKYAKGHQFTRGDIQQELPFGGYFVIVEITGAELIDILENSVSRIEYIDGRFLNISGMSAIYNSSLPAGSRIISVKVGEEPLVLDRFYRMAMQDFYLKGADDYTVLKNKSTLNNLFPKRRIWHIVTDYLSKLKIIHASPLNRLVNQAVNEN
ncbi:MAG: hypothetical protein OFPII_02170 [Osedax symbiont Rs1]|nr:MAG: hypothetical protein OFPII_02170 [Osedax symbiont Rs1]